MGFRTFIIVCFICFSTAVSICGDFSDLGLEGPVYNGSSFSIQTGKYARITLSPRWRETRCLKEMIAAAKQLQDQFGQFNFKIEGNIQNCEEFASGINNLVANREKVATNLQKFHSPLHSIILTNKTKFNHFRLDELGLHVDADRAGELAARLIDYRIGPSEIQHEFRHAKEGFLPNQAPSKDSLSL